MIRQIWNPLKRSELFLLFWISLFIVGGCVGLNKKTGGRSFSEGVRLPEHQEVSLSNGLKILFLRDKSLPRLGVMALVGTGAVSDPKGKEGLSYLTASLLDEGTAKSSSREIAEKLEGLGAALSIQPGYDFTFLSIRGLSYTRDQLLDSFLEVLLSPQFADQEFQRVQKMVQGSLTKVEDDPEGFTDQLMSQVLYGDHPYATPTMGKMESVRSLRQKDVAQFYKDHYLPSNTTVAVIGDFDDLFVDQVKTKFATWLTDQEKVDAGGVVKLKAPLPTTIYLKSKPGLKQAQIRLAQILIPRNDPDFLALRAANFALGGAFGSRLNQYVRDDLGLTYGVSSSFEGRRMPGPFVIDTFTRLPKVGETLTASLKVYREFVEKGITAQELQDVQSMLIGQFPRAVETMDSLAFQLLALKFYGVDPSYLTHFVHNVKSLTLEQVNESIHKHFRPDQMSIIIYGDGATIEGQLKSLGPVKKL